MVSPLVGVMLLLLITLALVGFAYLWFTGPLQIFIASLGELFSRKQQCFNMELDIDVMRGGASEGNISVTLRNRGVDTNLDAIPFYYGGLRVSSFGFTGILKSGKTITGTIRCGLPCDCPNPSGYIKVCDECGNCDSLPLTKESLNC